MRQGEALTRHVLFLRKEAAVATSALQRNPAASRCGRPRYYLWHVHVPFECTVMCGAAEKAEVYVMGKVYFPQLGKFIVAAIAHTCDGTSNVGGADISLRCSMLPTPELQGWGVFGTCILGKWLICSL